VRQVIGVMLLFVGMTLALSCADAEENESEHGKPVISSRYPIDFYGYIKLDAAYDTARTDVGNFARWVVSEDDNDDDDQFNMTARQSRFGLKFTGPEVERMTTSGRVEVDFYEGGSENKNRLMMRHAYLQVEWPDYDVSLLAGQTSDVISPLVPATLNYTVAWWVGDVGYRRPQVRVTKSMDVSEQSSAQFQFAAARTVGDDGPFGLGADTGEDAGFPSLQGRTALTFPCIDGKEATVGISGHWGEEEYDFDAADHSEDLDTWSVNLDVKVPVNDWLVVAGEVWAGENVDAYLGGVAQGIVVESDSGMYVNGKGWDPAAEAFVDADEIESRGGWLAVDFGPFGKWRYGLGASIDDPENGDLPDGARTRNMACWGNLRYSVNEAVWVGLELSYWDTEYKRVHDGDSMRVQTSFVYEF